MTAVRGQLASMLKVGLIGFGGGSALIPLIDDELVVRRKVVDATTFTRHTVVASITPGALPVKLAGLVGLHTSGAWLALAMALVVALPGTLATVGLVASVAAGGQAVIGYVELASVGITVFIIALLVHYISKVIGSSGPDRRAAIGIAVLAFVATGASALAELTGHLLGQDWVVTLPTLSAVQLVLGALVLISARALLRREDVVTLPPPQSGPLIDPRVARTVLLLLAVGAGAVTVAAVVAGPGVLGLLGLVAVSTLTSFGGGEAYVGVADGFFVGGGYVDSSVFYSQLVPIANALPGPILVKLASGVGYTAVAPEAGAAAGWVVAAASGLIAVTACTAVAVLVMGAYHRAGHSPVLRDIGRYILPVICGLLATTSVAMLNAVADVSDGTGVAPAVVLWPCLLAVVVVTGLRGRVHDVLLLLACGALSLGALLLV